MCIICYDIFGLVKTNWELILLFIWCGQIVITEFTEVLLMYCGHQRISQLLVLDVRKVNWEIWTISLLRESYDCSLMLNQLHGWGDSREHQDLPLGPSLLHPILGAGPQHGAVTASSCIYSGAAGVFFPLLEFQTEPVSALREAAACKTVV